MHPIIQTELTALYLARPATAPFDSPATYALKLAVGERAEPLARAVLRREDAVLRQVQHPHLATVVDRQLDGPAPHLVFPLPWARGQVPRCLAACASSASRSLRLAVWRVRQAAEAVASLHRGGWIHGRVSPDTIVVAAGGHVLVGDAGWARRIDSPECEAGELLAADLRYVAPECLLPRTTLTPSCDVYALGMILFELAAGTHPLVDSRPWQTALNQLRREMPDLRQLVPDAPPKLAKLVRQMTAKEPLRRPMGEEAARQLARLEIELLARRPVRDRAA
jgi:serine/threonine protein kinase